MPVIIYDFDGTLANSLEAGVEIYNRIARERGFKTITPRNRQHLRSLPPRKAIAELGLSIFRLPGIALRIRNGIRNSMENVRCPAGIHEAVTHFQSKHITQGILTSNSEANVKIFLKANKLDVFDFIQSGSSIFSKASALSALLKQHHIARTRAIYVGDEIRDIEAARAARIKAVAVGWGLNTPEALIANKPAALARTPHDLITIIEKLI